MKASKTAILGVVVAFIPLLIAACSDCLPIPAAGNRVSVQFYRTDSLESSDKRVAFDKKLLKLDALGSTDTFPSQSKTGTLEIWLPSHADTAIFHFTTLKGTETLKLAFLRKLLPQPPDCGAYIEFSQLSLISTNFDSVRILPISSEIQGFQLEIFDMP